MMTAMVMALICLPSCNMKLISVTRERKGKKEFKATFETDGKTKIVRFGTASNYVLNPNKTAVDRAGYHARHSKIVGANYNRADTPASLSRYLLWGDSRSLSRNLAAYRRRYRV